MDGHVCAPSVCVVVLLMARVTEHSAAAAQQHSLRQCSVQRCVMHSAHVCAKERHACTLHYEDVAC